ncbi:MAG: sulfite exporter TauE/SafE family protein [Clostridiaceae bacterium]
MNILTIIQGTMLALLGCFSFVFIKDYNKNKEIDYPAKRVYANLGVGFVTNFFDTLGIGSFAPTMASWKLFGLCKDRFIPGTLNVADCIPVAIEALIFMTVIKVDILTLVLMLIAGVSGAYLGVGIVSKLPTKNIQIAMGIALLIAAGFMLAGKFGFMPAGGEAIGLTGFKLVIAVVFNFIFGALLTLGIGNYAPCMVLIYALGMSPKVAFPIMMGSGAFVLIVAGIRFVKEGMYERKTAMAVALSGIVGVIIAAYIVKTLPISLLQWVVIVVVIYTSIMMLRSAFKSTEATDKAEENV